MSQQDAPQTHPYFLMTTDPVHIGVGGSRLGRVDNSIVREPGSRLPKIPGTSLHGAIRSYAAFQFGSPDCAGQTNHCGDPCCPICQTFGYAKGITEEQTRAGLVSISDARLLLFPVYSLAGPVWVTSPTALRDAGAENVPDVADEKVLLPQTLSRHRHLNLGWLMLPRANKGKDGFFVWPQELNAVPETIRQRAVLVSDALFSIIVNSNLEVRTSVSIDPNTGAALDKALFTYEAIPRTAILYMEVVVEQHRGTFPTRDNCAAEKDERELDVLQAMEKPNAADEVKAAEKKLAVITKWEESNVDWQSPLDVVKAGLGWMADLGVGGMGTRGFGRVRDIAVNHPSTTRTETQED